jgi:hypothetical protein
MSIHGISVHLCSGNFGFQVKNDRDEKVSVVVDYHSKDGSFASKRFDLDAKSAEIYHIDIPLKSVRIAGYFVPNT